MWRELLVEGLLDLIDVFASSGNSCRGRRRRRYRNPKTEQLREESRARESAMSARLHGMMSEIEERKAIQARTEEMRKSYVYEDDNAEMAEISAVGAVPPAEDDDNTLMDSI